MLNLLKVDFFRILKTKLVYISLIIAFVLPLVITGLFGGLIALIDSADADSGVLLGEVINGELLIRTTFSSTNNFGIVIPVFTVIIIMSDISSGTVRNKIIYGYKRHQIFASHFITSLTYCLAIMLVYASMTALWSIVILGAMDIDVSGLLHYVYFYVLGFLGLVVVVSIACALSLSLLNTPGAVILTVVITMFFGFLTSIVSMLLVGALELPEVAEHIFRFLPNYVITSYSQIDTTMFLEGLGGIALFSGGFYALGTCVFARRDFK